MAVKNDLEGYVFGPLRVIGLLNETNRYGQRLWNCMCSCGNFCKKSRSELLRGKWLSCGCMDLMYHTQNSTTHGLSNTAEWRTWHSMRMRCNLKTHAAYKDYGGRGITVCPEWDASFETFYRDMGPRPPRMTLERKNNDEGYCPGNCVWADRFAQQANQRAHRKSKTGIRGVSPIPNGKFLAQLVVKGRVVLNKSFIALEDAVSARKEAEAKYVTAAVTTSLEE